MTDVNQLIPMKYKWAWQKYLDANANNWTPNEISMGPDKAQYQTGELTPSEQHMYKIVLAYLTTSDIVIMRNVERATMRFITAPEIEIYLARQIFEESLHTWAYQHCLESIGMTEAEQIEFYGLYRSHPALSDKVMYAVNQTRALEQLDDSNPIMSYGRLRALLLGLIFYYAVFEGGWFYGGFNPIFSLHRRNKMSGTAEQLQYIRRDESMHVNFGIDMINQIRAENPGVWLDFMDEDVNAMFHTAVELEEAYASHAIPYDIIGYNRFDHVEHLKHLFNIRARKLGLAEPYPGTTNPFPWLSEVADVKKEKNFFETRVTEYQVGTQLTWDE
jgi:ribonucleoside-diphosphate reductase beta chain